MVDIDFDFLVEKYGFINGAEQLQRALRADDQVRAFSDRLDAGNLAPKDLLKAAKFALREFTPGRHMLGLDVLLSTIAVVSLNHVDQAIDEFLKDLASLEIAELPMSPRVASRCLDIRNDTLPGWTSKEFVLGSWLNYGINFEVRDRVPVSSASEDLPPRTFPVAA